MRLYKQIQVLKDDEVIYDSGLQPSHSFVLQFLRILGSEMAGATYAAVDTGNTSRNVLWASIDRDQLMLVDAGDTTSVFGIVVGTGTAAEANDDYKLDTQVTHGVGGGQLSHGHVEFTEAAVVGANVDMIVRRPFHNASGGAITINEIGIYSTGIDTSANSRYFCIVRDKLGVGVPVASGATLLVSYTVRTTV